MSLCHMDGTIHKTQKSAIVQVLETNFTNKNVPRFDIVVVDGFLLLHSM